MKSFFTFALGAAAGAFTYHMLTKAAEVVVEVVVDNVIG